MPTVSVLQILRTIKDRGAVSRTDLQQLTGLSWGTVTNTTRVLLNRKYIREEGALSTKTGRKPMRLALNTAVHCLVGVELGVEGLRCLVLNLGGEVLWQEKSGADGPEVMVVRAVEMIRRALSSGDVVARTNMGIGVAVPGSLDVGRGVVKAVAYMRGWREVAIRDMLEKRLHAVGLGGETLRLETRMNCLAIAERWFGQAGGVEDLLCIELGMGVGLGVMTAGSVLRGSEGAAGDFGHVTVDPDGPLCACGKSGCVEVYAALGAVLEYAKSHAAEGDVAGAAGSVEELARLAGEGNRVAVEAFGHMGRHLGLGVANLLALFNPGLVVLAGRTTAGAAHFMPAVTKELGEAPGKMVVSQLGDQAAAMGACGVILQAAFEPEGMERETGIA